MVLNALHADPKKIWKGIWRWYSDEMLVCCENTAERMKLEGVNFDQFVCLARCHGLQVASKRADSTTALDEFERDIVRAVTSPDRHLVVSFSRATLGQTGIGHFSPIAGYHRQKRMVLILDVARFKYPSFWVKVDELYKAMQEIDATTGKPRGYILLGRRDG
jgi:glutathione gamma-glutamylcysteinyltransferase